MVVRQNLKMAPNDTAKAKALLAKAGFPNGFEITLWAMPVQRAYNPNARLMAEMIHRLGEDRREGEDRHVRVGRVHQARALG